MSSRFDHYPSGPNCQQCRNAFTLLRNAHDTSGSFLEVFNATRKGRNAKGASTDKDQDLLRAMLTFACAGLDSLVKQLINDALPDVINCNEAAELMFRRDIERRIRRGEERRLTTGFLKTTGPAHRDSGFGPHLTKFAVERSTAEGRFVFCYRVRFNYKKPKRPSSDIHGT